MPKYLFYDLETTGLHPVFDQILQFAAILTDDGLREISRHEITVRLRPDIIPSPKALTVRRSPVSALTSGISEYDAICQIHKLVNRPDTFNIGFNSLRFDDKFLRFGFYRSLLPAYTHQYAQGCRRGDLLPMAVLYRLFAPAVLEWPTIDGKESLKLEHLSQANGLGTGEAHRAIADVQACVDLARRLVGCPTLWKQAWSYFDKESDEQRIGGLPLLNDGSTRFRKGLIAANYYGSALNYQVPVLHLGRSKRYPKKETVWLRLDQEDLPSKASADLTDGLIITKLSGEPGLVLDLSEHALTEERSKIARSNTQWLLSEPETLKRYAALACANRYPEVINLDTDATLYQRSFDREIVKIEEAEHWHFHAADLKQKQILAPIFTNPIDCVLAIRLLGRNFGPAGHSADFAAYLARLDAGDNPPCDYKGGPKRTRQAALAEIETLLQTEKLDDEQLAIVNELKTYLLTNPGLQRPGL